MDLIDILRRPEGKTLEFKRDLSGPLGVVKTIVAFANTAGGTLLLGVEDGSRHVRGVRDALGLEERLANLISERRLPRGRARGAGVRPDYPSPRAGNRDTAVAADVGAGWGAPMST